MVITAENQEERLFFQRDSIPILVSSTVKTQSSNCCIFKMKHTTGMETCTKIYLQPGVNKTSLFWLYHLMTSLWKPSIRVTPLETWDIFEWMDYLSSLLIYPSYLLPEMISKFSNILLSFIQAESSLVGDVFCARTLNINFKSVPCSKYLHLHPWRKFHLQFNIQGRLNGLNINYSPKWRWLVGIIYRAVNYILKQWDNWAQKWRLSRLLNSFIIASNYNFGAQWPNDRRVFLPTNTTFEGICLAFSGKFRQKELWILFVFKTIL